MSFIPLGFLSGTEAQTLVRQVTSLHSPIIFLGHILWKLHALSASVTRRVQEEALDLFAAPSFFA
jgi:hypothetical protein